jgi:arylsulfatase A-like enzyme
MHYSGKWHVSVEERPQDRGWNEHFVSATAKTHHGWHWDEYRQVADNPEPEERQPGQILRPGYGTYQLYGTRAENDPHDETAVAKGVKVLNSLSADSEPWCLYVGAIGPHDPYLVTQKYLDMYDPADIELPVNFADSLADKPAIYSRMRDTRFGQLSPEETRDAIRHFYAYCTYLDDIFGQLLTALDETGQADNTLVLYCADHGDYCGEHGLFAKGIPCFQGAYHVPAVFRWPNGIKNPGRRVNEFVSLADYAPTFLDAAGVNSDRYFTGKSLMPFLQNNPPASWRDAVFTQCNGVELYYTQRSVMTRDFKYVFNGFDQDELYDLRVDPHELRNVADDPHYAGIKRELCGRMWAFGRQEDDMPINPYITTGLAPYGPAEGFRW